MDFETYIGGYVPSTPDHMDYIYGQILKLGAPGAPGATVALPSSFSYPDVPILDQGRFGTCVGHGTTYQILYRILKNTGKLVAPLSRLFIYSESKKRDGAPTQEGTQPKVAMQVANQLGICYESTFPYSQLTDITKVPNAPQSAYAEALPFRTSSYARVSTDLEIKTALYNDGPVGFAVFVCSSFTTPEEGGFIDLPSGNILGGHYICCIGWDDNLTHEYKNGVTRKGFYKCINSWTDQWGERGYCWIPYDFVHGKTDYGQLYLSEAWTCVESVFTPTKLADRIELWLDKTDAIVNGVHITLDQAPSLDRQTNRTLVPIRFIAEQLGFQVDYNPTEQKITITK